MLEFLLCIGEKGREVYQTLTFPTAEPEAGEGGTLVWKRTTAQVRAAFKAGRLHSGRENGLQSDDRCVMRQRTGASVFFERIREGARFGSIVFVRFLLRFYEKFQEILNLKFQNNVSFNV